MDTISVTTDPPSIPPTTTTTDDKHLLPGIRRANEDIVDHDIPLSADSESASDCCTPTRSVPPIHLEQESLKNEEARIVVLETCGLLLTSVESIKLSLLTLQYSLHTGAIGGGKVPAAVSDPRKIWSWDQPTTLDESICNTSEFAVNVFDPSNIITDELTLLPHGVYDVFDGGGSIKIHGGGDGGSDGVAYGTERDS